MTIIRPQSRFSTNMRASKAMGLLALTGALSLGRATGLLDVAPAPQAPQAAPATVAAPTELSFSEMSQPANPRLNTPTP